MFFQPLNIGYSLRKHPQEAILNGLLTGGLASVAAIGGQYVAAVTEGFRTYHWFFGDPLPMAIAYVFNNVRLDHVLQHGGALALFSGALVGLAVAWAIWDQTPRSEPFDQPNPNDPKIFFDRDAEQQLRLAFEKDGGRTKSRPLYIAPHVPIAGRADLKNFLMCGTAGTGKSNLIRPITAQAIARGDMVVLHCSKGDVTQSFDPSKIVLVSPTHRDGWAWNMAEDIVGHADVTEFAAMVIPESDQPFFSDTARLVFADIVVSVIEDYRGNWDARLLLQRVLADVEAIAQRIERLDLSASPLITSGDPDGASRTVESVMATMISGAMTTLKPMAFAWSKQRKQKRFSIRRMFSASWKGPKVMIVQTNANFSVLSENLCGGLISRICRHVTSPEANMGGRRVTMILDEFNSLGRIAGFARALSVAREKMLMTVVGVQSLQQVHKLYGDEAREILDLLQIKIFGRQGDGQSAKEASENLGKRQAAVTVRNRNPSTDDKRRFVTETVALPVFSQNQFEGELGNFHPGKRFEVIAGLVCYAGKAYRIDWPPTKWQQQSPGYVEASWTQIVQSDSE